MKDSCRRKKQDQCSFVSVQNVNSALVQSQRMQVIAQCVEIQLKDNMERSIHSSMDLVRVDFMIRRVGLDDLDEVMRIERSCFPVAWEYTIFLNICLQNGEMRSGESRTLFMDVIENGAEVAGYVVWEIDAKTKEGHILNLATRQDERRSGKAKRLLTHVLNNLRNTQINTCHLEVRESNFPARRLYESYGFIETDRIQGYYFDEDAIIYSINL